MPVIILTFLLRTADGVVPEDLALVKDLETCQTIATILNKVVAEDPNAGFICREAKPPTKA
jgi:hypothetical protein